MEPPLAVFPPEQTVAETVERVRELAKKALVTYGFVVDPSRKLIGLVTMRDLLLSTREQRLADMMLREPFALKASESASEAMRQVVKRHFPVYPVVDADGRLVGQVRGNALFEERVFEHRANLQRLIRSLIADGKRVLGYGASTKGNVLLQFCGFTAKDLPAIAEVNPDKFGCFTPGSAIPIVSEAEARAMSPDYFLVLPWHFKDAIVAREEDYLARGGKMIFPLPEIEILGG